MLLINDGSNNLKNATLGVFLAKIREKIINMTGSKFRIAVSKLDDTQKKNRESISHKKAALQLMQAAV